MKKPLWILATAALLLATIGLGQSAPFGDSPKAGADYRVHADRMATVKLTDAEALNLITTIHVILDSGEIRRADVDAALVQVFGPDRAAEYLRLFDAREGRGQRWSRRENVAMIGAMYPHIPGETEEQKAEWLITKATPCFTPERWNDQVFPYVLQRVQEYKDAGGTLERWPEVIVPPEPEIPDTGIPEGTTWLHHDVSTWPVTRPLEVSFAGDHIRLDYGDNRAWPAGRSATDGGDVNANAWIFVQQDGQWYAATWEWLRVGQSSKPTRVVEGGHIKASPLSSFRPISGETYGFMVSGLARGPERNVSERSEVKFVTWP